ncbi:hypothetical protein BKH43_02975 [Helicobacter sp. 13S00401-1]|uniref:FeoA family protein n=1 Tax=Helicobacter sp. 13S00401-1 TaxID=1905758 RepID=UPI000BA7C8D9|nr:FeoA family protein [Helicobacter sp. 13S00401-1]PAF51185.1 hypothetical protein BKH43_02975 [Helicobacter sp. 13S00401-1]
MTLINAVHGKYYKIDKIDTKNQELINRFMSLGVYEGTVVTPAFETSLKQTYSVYIDGMQVALRRSEAKIIYIEEVVGEAVDNA